MSEVLSQDQIEFYGDNGYLVLENRVPDAIMDAIRSEIERFNEMARGMTASDDKLDLEDTHSPDAPRIRRVKLPHTQSEVVADLMRSDHILAPVRDLLGPNLRLQTTKLNMKSAGYGAAVEWHQDWAFYPHTNDDLLAFGIMLEDVTPDNGPLMVIPGTHKGPLLSHKHEGLFCGAIHPDDPLFEQEKAVTLTGKAGSMTVHHVRTLHGSAPNMSDKNRLILFYELASGDAWPILGAGSYLHELGQRKFWEDLQTRLVTGSIITEPRLEKVPASMPLAPAADNTSIFKTQKSGGAKSAFS